MNLKFISKKFNKKEILMKTSNELKALFESSIQKSNNLYFTCSGHGAARDAYMSGIYSLYYNMFGTYPYEFEICQFLEPLSSFDNFTKEDFKFAKKYIYKYDKYHRVDFIKTLYNISNRNKENSYITSFSGITMIILDKYIIYWNQESSFAVLCPEYITIEENIKIDCDKIHFLNIAFCGDVWNNEFKINDYLEYIKLKKERVLPMYHYVIHGPQGFDVTDFPLKDYININISENYNDDLPYEETIKFLNTKDESGLIIFNGIPGTGKSFLIRHLITNLKDKDFIIINESCLSYISDPTFLKLMMKYNNSVIILEDCEQILVDRNNGNGLISTLLNLSDGIISDAFNLKFICTFNANISKIDTAVLRKGRLKVKYTFGKLSKEKTKALAEKLGKNVPNGSELVLADIYNFDEEVEHGSKKKNIGFVTV